MPACNSGSLILVTGASGFLGTTTLEALLKAGFRVRATVRSKEKGEYVAKQYPGVEYAVVPDMTEPHAYDAAVKDVDGVINIASPVELSHTGDPQLLIRPAVAGLTTLLEAVSDPKNGGKVTRIVQVSSIFGVARNGPDGGKVDETVWNETDVAAIDKPGCEADDLVAYSASKVIAEREFWKWFETKKRAYDGVAILPGLILGPPTEYSPKGDTGGSVGWAAPYAQPGITDEGVEQQWPNLVDSRDVAQSLVRALEVPAAANERFLIVADHLFGNDMALAAAKVNPDRDINKGNPDPEYRAKLAAKAFIWDGSKAAQVLGVTYRPKHETLEDMYKGLNRK